MKKAKTLLFSLILIAMLVSACGGGAATQVSSNTQSAASGEKVNKVNLVYWSMWNVSEPQAITMAELIKEFEADNPNITISVVWNGRENQTKVRTSLGSNTPIDLVDQDEDQIAGGLVHEGMALPLDDLLNSTALNENVPLKDVFLPGTLDTYSQNGVHYLLPYGDQPVMFWYNKDIFAKAGISQPPTTWDEFLAAAQKIKDAGYVPIAMEGDVHDYSSFYFTYLIERMKGKGFLINAIEDKTGEAWIDPTFAKAIQMIQELWDKGYIPDISAGYQWPAGQQTLATGKAAMELCGGWLPEELNPIAGEDYKWGGFRFPAVSGGVGGIDDIQQWLFAFIILKDSAHPEEAKQFLKFLMTKDAQQKFSSGATYGVTHKDVQWPEDEADGVVASASAKVVFTHADGGMALHAEYTKNILFANYHNAFLRKLSPEEFQAKLAADSKNYWSSHK